MSPPHGDRYSRQVLFRPFGAEGQARVRAARVLVAGCGGLGAESASLLARAGVGFLRVVDRDVVELSNLQRQALFDEADVREGLPKAIAAARRIGRVNADVAVEPVVADVGPGNVRSLLDGIDLVIDGFDSFEARFLLNDACVEKGLPWVYGACIAATGLAALLVPACPCCAGRRFDFLSVETSPASALCGRDSVQVRPLVPSRPDFAALAERLRPLGEVVSNDYLLRYRADDVEMTLFSDGRAIVKGTTDPARARSLVARTFGV